MTLALMSTERAAGEMYVEIWASPVVRCGQGPRIYSGSCIFLTMLSSSYMYRKKVDAELQPDQCHPIRVLQSRDLMVDNDGAISLDLLHR